MAPGETQESQSETNHTPEPWPEQPGLIGGYDGAGKPYALLVPANYERAVACVNACAGMADPAAEIQRLRTENARMRQALDIDRQRGGAWLGAAREWLKWNHPRGALVTWGSDEVLDGIKVRDIEDIAGDVAEAVRAEARVK